MRMPPGLAAVLAAALAAALAGCGTMEVARDPRPLSVDFAFGRAQACGPGEGPYRMRMTQMSRRSPAIRVGGVPAGTAALAVEMVDLDLAGFDHGGGRVPLAPGMRGEAVIPEGALDGWMGPCPPTGSDHRYEMRVRALDGAGRALAGGAATRTCCRGFEGGG
jgi:hypothetical protein